MVKILKKIERIRDSIKKGPADMLLLQKPFAIGMYRFTMFMMTYYSRVRGRLKLDYDSFMIIQTVASHTLYLLSKKKTDGQTYDDLEIEWEHELTKHKSVLELVGEFEPAKLNNLRLTISSVCLVLGLPKETVRRKINVLCKKNLLKISLKDGILLGPAYKKVFSEFVPQTVLEVSKLLKNWEKNGVLINLINFKI